MPVPRRFSLLRPLLSALALVAAIVVVLYVGIGTIKATLRTAFETQRALGDVQRYTGLAISRQLDEEAAIRGFVGSGRRLYLEPYAAATREFAFTFDALSDALVRAGLPEERASVAQAAEMNRQWQDLVARPLLADRQRRDRAFVEVRGKTLVDRYRAAIAQIDRAVRDATTREMTAAALAVSRVSGIGLVTVLLVGIVLLISLRAQSRMGRELDAERRVAAAMQRGLLQASLPLVASIAFDASYVPAGREAFVGGDWYDVLALPDGRVLFSIGDVAGHGVEAAVVMSRAREAIVALGYAETDPARVLARANEVLILQQSQVATAIFGYVDPVSRTIVYALAGHPPPLVAGPTTRPTIRPYGGVPLGIVRGHIFENETFVAEPGSAIVLYTDGFTERTRDVSAGECALLDAAAELGKSGYGSFATRIHRKIFGDVVPSDDALVVTMTFAPSVADASDEDRDGKSALRAEATRGRVG